MCPLAFASPLFVLALSWPGAFVLPVPPAWWPGCVPAMPLPVAAWLKPAGHVVGLPLASRAGGALGVALAGAVAGRGVGGGVRALGVRVAGGGGAGVRRLVLGLGRAVVTLGGSGRLRVVA